MENLKTYQHIKSVSVYTEATRAIQNGSKAIQDGMLTLTSPKAVFTLIALAFFFLVPNTVFAGNPLIDNDLTRGLLRFAADVGPWLAGTAVVLGVANCGLCLVRRANCDESDAKKWNDRIKNTLVFSGIAAVVTGVAPPILNHYFGV